MLRIVWYIRFRRIKDVIRLQFLKIMGRQSWPSGDSRRLPYVTPTCTLLSIVIFVCRSIVKIEIAICQKLIDVSYAFDKLSSDFAWMHSTSLVDPEGEHGAMTPFPKSTQNGRKFDTFSEIIGNLSNFHEIKLVLSQLLIHKQAKSDEFSELCETSLDPPPPQTDQNQPF